ncbi:MAG: large ribosomal subunit protein bL35, partial [Mycoplasma sp.]
MNKTKKSISKRFKISSNGKVKGKASCKNHLANSKTSKQQRQKRKDFFLSKPDNKKY